MALRALPRIGSPVTIVYLAARMGGTIERVSSDLHELQVVAEDGETVTFRLNRATARFTGAGPHAGARLVF